MLEKEVDLNIRDKWDSSPLYVVVLINRLADVYTTYFIICYSVLTLSIDVKS